MRNCPIYVFKYVV